MRKWGTKASRLRSIMKKIDAIDPTIVDNVINPSDYVKVNRYSGFDVRYTTKSGKSKTVKFYDKRGIKLSDLSRTELTAIRDSVNREYLDKVLPKSLLEMRTDKPIKKAISSGKFRQTRLGKSIALIDKLGIELDPDDLDDELTLEDIAEEENSDILNLFYHSFGAMEENVITVNAFKKFMELKRI